jgi:phosphatidylinositol glycan class V
VLAALALHGLTYQLVSTSERVSKLENGSKSDSQAPAFALKAAHVTSNLFCINPANVFFMAAYSEATFCFLTFSGHCFYATYLWERSRIQLCGAVILWTLASYARSNGSFSAIFIFISCCARIIYQWSPSMRKTIMKSVWNVLSHALIAFLIVLPVLYHDKRGYDFHCTLDDEKTPEWCENESTDFSLYGHVQRKHWNVGFLRYYELKQIPNFLLAAPILCLGTSAVVNWICNSYSNYCLTLGKCDTNSLSLLRWAIFSLGLSGGTKTNVANTKMKKVDESIITESLLGSNMLAHYAILVGFVFVGITIAHVQISTRLICSSCPAIYWYISSLVLTSDDTEDRMPRDKWIGGKFGKSQDILIVYLLGYNVLGILLHVNWLPWT